MVLQCMALLALLTLFLYGMTLFLSRLCGFFLWIKISLYSLYTFYVCTNLKNLVFPENHDSFHKSIFFLTLFLQTPAINRGNLTLILVGSCLSHTHRVEIQLVRVVIKLVNIIITRIRVKTPLVCVWKS
jgi:hypothetical protein